MNPPTSPATPRRVAVGLGLAPDVVHLPRAELIDLVSRINDSPIDHVAVTDHVAFRGGRGWDAITAMTFLSGAGVNKPLHTGVLILPLRHPTVLARQLLDLADLHAPGIVLGVGLGGDDPTEYSMVGMSTTNRGARMDDALTVLVDLLGPQRAIDTNGWYGAAGPGLDRGTGAPVAVLVGGRADAAIRRAAQADGWLATFCSPERFAAGRAKLLALADGTPASPAVTGYQAWVGIGPDGRANADKVLADFYGMDPAPFHRYTPTGRADELIEAFEPYVTAGANLLNLFAASPDPFQSVATISSVAAALRTAT